MALNHNAASTSPSIQKWTGTAIVSIVTKRVAALCALFYSLTASSTVEEILSSAPAQDDFYVMVIKEIPADWEIFGVLVNIPHGTRKEISHDNSKQAKKCFLAVYSIWKNGQTQEFTWRTVLNVLTHMEQESLKEKIKRKLGIC